MIIANRSTYKRLVYADKPFASGIEILEQGTVNHSPPVGLNCGILGILPTLLVTPHQLVRSIASAEIVSERRTAPFRRAAG